MSDTAAADALFGDSFVAVNQQTDFSSTSDEEGLLQIDSARTRSNSPRSQFFQQSPQFHSSDKRAEDDESYKSVSESQPDTARTSGGSRVSIFNDPEFLRTEKALRSEVARHMTTTASSCFPPGFKTSGFLRPLSSPSLSRLGSPPKLVSPRSRPCIKTVDPSKLTASQMSQTQNKLLDDEENFPVKPPDVESDTNIPPEAAKIAAEERILELEDGSTYTLHPHQVIGFEWLLTVFEDKGGCILADDMGLGKTVQSAVFLRRLFQERRIKRVLILSPKSVLEQWQDHLRLLVPKLAVHLFHGQGRERRLQKFQMGESKYAVLTTYETYRSSEECLKSACNARGATRPWDVWIADEATAMKNHSTALWKAASQMNAQCRIFLTGTPIMNRYDELWALMDLVQPNILGSYAQFCDEYACLLNRRAYGNEDRRDAKTRQMRDKIMPFILRRTKEEIFPHPSSSALTSETELASGNSSPQKLSLPKKTEILVWQDLTPLQREVYSSMRQRIDFRDRKGILFYVSMLKKLCRHPVLCLPADKQIWKQQLDPRHTTTTWSDEQLEDFEVYGSSQEPLTPAIPSRMHNEEYEETEIFMRVDQTSPEGLRHACKKLTALYNLLPRLAEADHITLVFSESTATLSLVEISVLSQLSLKYHRIDGSLTLKQRQAVLREFREDPEVKVLLLSTGAGCLGLNLTRADRVILLDPSWNPAKDIQAIDRVYRIGQKRPVIIYRFIIGGAIEDNMIRLQLFKMNLSSSILLGAGQKSWFTIQELRDLYSLSDCEHSKTRQLLSHLTEHEDQLQSEVSQELLDDPEPLETLHAAGLACMDDVIKEIEDAKARQKSKWSSSL